MSETKNEVVLGGSSLPHAPTISKLMPMRQASYNTSPTWAVVIFASRESLDMLTRTIKAAQIAARGTAGIDVVINGNTPLAVALVKKLNSPELATESAPLRVWAITMGDKANAWNQYLHRIWSGESIAFFVDGYVQLNPDSLKLLGEAIATQVDILGGTGVPNTEATTNAKHAQPSPESGFHGNFCCLKSNAIEQLRRQNIYLPFGLYRVDSLMGALLSLGFDPACNTWVGSRIFVHPAASWQTDPKRWWQVSDIRAQIKRVFRQSRGVLENLAARDHLVVRKQPPEMMPATASELVLDWVLRCPAQANKVLRHHPIAQRALAEIKQSPGTVADNTPPMLMGSNSRP